MKKYDNYKDSGIEWIGEIPDHWDAIKLKYTGESIIGIIYSPDDVVNEGEGILVLRASNIQEGKLAFEDCVYVDKEVQDKHLTREGDILVCARNGSAHLVGKSAYIDKENEGVTFGAFMSIVRSELDKYLFHFLNSPIFRAQTGLFSTSTINQLTSSTLNNMFISVPPDETEQIAIVTYLDRKTTELDELIADKKRLLELYEEEKTAIINKAVTKGLNPDAPMKDSGIEWLGEVPEHWEVKRLKYVASINDEVLTDKTDEEYEIEYVEISGVKNGIGIVDTVYYKFKDAPSRARRIVNDGDVLVSTVRTYLKSIAKVDNPPTNLIASTGFAVVRSRKINSDYTGFLFYSEPLIGEIISLSTGVSYPAINPSQIEDISIPIPPSEEQQAIIKYIESNCSLIDTKVTKTKILIDLLTEYRTALISEVVTGKIKVTE
jgi:type I restriction enzyme S subunit